MKRIIVSIIVLSIVGSILVGCTPSNSNSVTSNSAVNNEVVEEEVSDVRSLPNRYEIIRTEMLPGLRITLYYDKITGIVYQYTHHQSGYSGGGSTTIVTDIDGVPILYDAFIEQYQKLD